MKVTKLVLGIITIVLSVLVLFQSCAAGASNALSENGESSGTAGLFVAILMLAGSIVMIATRKGTSSGGSIAGMIIFLLASLIGFPNAGSFGDLKVWAVLCLILAVINLIAAINKKKNSKTDSDSDD
jgi:hypothetical protein